MYFLIFPLFYTAPAGNDGKNYVHETVFDGMDVIGVLTFYQCHVPSSVTLSIIIPSLEIAWKSSNTTSDIQEPRGKNGFYFIFNSCVIHTFVFFVNEDIISGFFLSFVHFNLLVKVHRFSIFQLFQNLQQKSCP